MVRLVQFQYIPFASQLVAGFTACTTTLLARDINPGPGHETKTAQCTEGFALYSASLQFVALSGQGFLLFFSCLACNSLEKFLRDKNCSEANLS